VMPQEHWPKHVHQGARVRYDERCPAFSTLSKDIIRFDPGDSCAALPESPLIAQCGRSRRMSMVQRQQKGEK